MKNLGYEIKGFDHCEFYVGNAKQASHFYKQTLGFEIIAYRGLETGSRERVSYVLNQGKINFVLTSPLKRDTSIGKHINAHGDGIRDVAFEVNDAKVAWKNSVDRGAKSIQKPKKISDSMGFAIVSAVATFGDTIHSFIERKNYSGPFLPGYETVNPKKKKTNSLHHIDHIVGNQAEGQMIPVCNFYEKVFNWQRFWSVDDKDINTDYSSLKSIVMANENQKVKMPINEPAKGKKKSQIQEFIDYYESAGIQHLALSTDNILETVKNFKSNGVEFLNTPKSYYENLESRVGKIDEDIDELSKYGILVDSDENGYLLQIFTKPLQDRPTLFFEIIQRKGSSSFGKGNFKALFQSIEKEQLKRGNL